MKLSKNAKIIYDIMWKKLKAEREMRYENSECGGDEVSESIDMLQADIDREIEGALKNGN